MTGFSAEWLALRAPADDAARDAGLVKQLADWIAGRAITITDLGGGSGAAHRALSSVAPLASWRILDDDPTLLSLIPDGAAAVETDLAASLDDVFNPRPDLLTAFAFIDLVSANWLQNLADRTAKTGAAIYAPLTYDGMETWRPTPPFEAAALDAFNKDMRRDKGFGPALGADAAPQLAALMRERGYRVMTASSPWRLSRGPLLQTLAKGSTDAVKPYLSEDEFKAWERGRRAADAANIGHIDLLALPG